MVGGGKAAKRTGAELVQILGYKITAGVLNVYRDQAEEPISERITEKCRCENNGDRPDLRRGLIIDSDSGRRNQYRRLPGFSRLLMTVPATIDEINAVRKHIDLLKGGRMLHCAANAGAFISLVSQLR